MRSTLPVLAGTVTICAARLNAGTAGNCFGAVSATLWVFDLLKPVSELTRYATFFIFGGGERIAEAMTCPMTLGLGTIGGDQREGVDVGRKDGRLSQA